MIKRYLNISLASSACVCAKILTTVKNARPRSVTIAWRWRDGNVLIGAIKRKVQGYSHLAINNLKTILKKATSLLGVL